MATPSKRDSRLTFAQREAGASLPQQMARDEVSRRLRIQIFTRIRVKMITETGQDIIGQPTVVGDWLAILYGVHTEILEKMPDDMSLLVRSQSDVLKRILENGSYAEVYGLLEYILRHDCCPDGLADELNAVLEATQAAYRIVGDDTLIPYASDDETEIVARALEDMGDPRFEGAKKHYKAAVECLSAGDYAGSMRESIHAVESVTKLLTGEKTLQDGVAKLARQKHLHVTVQAALEKIAAWTNAVAGIRHANDAAAAKPDVDENDATFLLATCGATISYLKRRGEKADLLK